MKLFLEKVREKTIYYHMKPKVGKKCPFHEQVGISYLNSCIKPPELQTITGYYRLSYLFLLHAFFLMFINGCFTQP